MTTINTRFQTKFLFAPVVALLFSATFATPCAQALTYSAEQERAVTLAACNNELPALEQLAVPGDDYSNAYAHYRLATLSYLPGQKSDPADHLKQVLNLLESSDDAEADVLKAAAQGMLLGIDPSNAAEDVAQINRWLNAARRNEQAAPRADLIEGISVFYTPPAFGGGLDRARELFEASIAGFAGQDGSSRVHWGGSEAYIWLGQVLLREGDKLGAEQAFNQALALDPECGWARHWLAQM